MNGDKEDSRGTADKAVDKKGLNSDVPCPQGNTQKERRRIVSILQVLRRADRVMSFRPTVLDSPIQDFLMMQDRGEGRVKSVVLDRLRSAFDLSGHANVDEIKRVYDSHFNCFSFWAWQRIKEQSVALGYGILTKIKQFEIRYLHAADSDLALDSLAQDLAWWTPFVPAIADRPFLLVGGFVPQSDRSFLLTGRGEVVELKKIINGHSSERAVLTIDDEVRSLAPGDEVVWVRHARKLPIVKNSNGAPLINLNKQDIPRKTATFYTDIEAGQAGNIQVPDWQTLVLRLANQPSELDLKASIIDRHPILLALERQPWDDIGENLGAPVPARRAFLRKKIADTIRSLSKGYNQYQEVLELDKNWHPLQGFVDHELARLFPEPTRDQLLADLLERVKSEKIEEPVSSKADKVLIGIALISLGVVLVGAGGSFLAYALYAVDAGLSITSGVIKEYNAHSFRHLDRLNIIKAYLKTPYSAGDGLIDILLGVVGMDSFLGLLRLAKTGKLARARRAVQQAAKNPDNAMTLSKLDNTPAPGLRPASQAEPAPTVLQSNRNTQPEIPDRSRAASGQERGVDAQARGGEAKRPKKKTDSRQQPEKNPVETSTEVPVRSISTPTISGKERVLEHLRSKQTLSNDDLIKLGNLPDSEWEKLLEIANSNLNAFKKAKNKSTIINKLKGFVHEAFIANHPAINRLIERTRELVQQFGFDPASVKFTSNITDNYKDLSDGFVYAKSSSSKILIIGVIESKSKNFRLMAKEPGSVYGQMERTLARLETGDVIIDGIRYTQEQIVLLRDFGLSTQWLGVVPDKLLSPKKTQNFIKDVRNQGRKIELVENILTDDAAYKVAKEVFETID